MRKKQDAFGQKWKVWPSQVPRRAVTLLGTCRYVEPETAKASNGWWAPKRTVCLGEENEKIDQIPPEWLTAPPNKYEKHIKAAAKEEDWLLEVSVERKMKALCRASNALEIFNQYDDDGSGELDYDELARVLEKWGLENVSEADVEQLVKRFDVKKNGKLDFDEFRSGVEGSQSQLQSLLEIFTFTATSGSADAPQPSRRLKGDGGKDDADDEEDLVTEGDCAVQ